MHLQKELSFILNDEDTSLNECRPILALVAEQGSNFSKVRE